MKYYKLTIDNFKRVIEFGTKFYLTPTKNTTGRTTGEPRGIGAVLDSFTLGKLTEIGIEKILTHINNEKKFILDFDIKDNLQVKNDPDIIKILENQEFRDPNIFIEIKNTSENDRWVGLTEEQFNTIKRSSINKEIFFIYASIRSSIVKKNPKTADLTGMFLKEIEDKNKSLIFQNFSKLNAECSVEFIISATDIEKFGFPFERGMNIYETYLFTEKSPQSFYSISGVRKDVYKIYDFMNFNGKMQLEIENGVFPEKEDISVFNILGSFKIIEKKKKKYIQCRTETFIFNNIFGQLELKGGKFYTFNLETLGRDPKLKRNNLFISKKKIYQLIADGYIRNPISILREIAEKI